MYGVEERLYKGYELIDLIDYHTNTIVTIAPERGGIVISYKVDGVDVIYLNEPSFINEEESIRGGIPILFPSAGKLTHQTYEWNGQAFQMPNHGFARNLTWEVKQKNDKDEASVILCIKSNEQTFMYYPFQFEVIYTYILNDNRLKIEQMYINHSEERMPMHIGFHPYFNTSTHQLEYETDADSFYNDVENILMSMTNRIDLTNSKGSIFIVNAKTPEIRFQLPEINKTIEMNYGNEFKYIVLWTEPKADFICVEPWTAKPDELNRKQELLMIEPGKQLNTHLTIMVK